MTDLTWDSIVQRLPDRIQRNPAALQRLQQADPALAAAMVGDYFWKPRIDGQLGNVRCLPGEELFALRQDVYCFRGGQHLDADMEFWRTLDGLD